MAGAKGFEPLTHEGSALAEHRLRPLDYAPMLMYIFDFTAFRNMTYSTIWSKTRFIC